MPIIAKNLVLPPLKFDRIITRQVDSRIHVVFCLGDKDLVWVEHPLTAVDVHHDVSGQLNLVAV